MDRPRVLAVGPAEPERRENAGATAPGGLTA